MTAKNQFTFNNVTRALVNNPRATFGFFTAILFTLAGTTARVLLEGHFVYIGWGMFIIGVAVSIPPFITIALSAARNGEKITPISSSSTEPLPGDYIAEADIYIAFGKKKDAIKILEEGMQDHPGNVEIEDKLKVVCEESKRR